MYQAAKKYSDICLVTNDNPRWEAPHKIIRDIISQANPEDNFWILPDRKKAIQTAISLAKSEDIVLVAGKGHETYQEIKGEKHYLNDVEIAESKINYNSAPLSIPMHSLFLEKIFAYQLPNQYITAISTDSRQLQPTSLFFALTGDNFDAHDYIDDVLAIPNCLAVVKENFPNPNKRLLKVKSPLEAMGKLAKKYLQLFNVTKIALTGSVGKTTCKEFIYNILSEAGATQKTLANENNQIGLPRTIFRMKPATKYAVLELGTNHFGEIEYLTQIAQPNIGIITKIGATHLEFLKSIEGVFQEKSALMRFPLQTRIFPGDENRFRDFEGITFGKKPNNDFQIHKITNLDNKTTFWLNNEDYEINSPFSVHAYNAAIAVILAKKLQIDEKFIHTGLAKPLRVNYRMQIMQFQQQTYLADCYNANPDSMLAAIEFWQNYQSHRPHVAILGDMLELGQSAAKHHKDISRKMKNEKFDSFISIGKYATLYEADNHFDSVDDFLQADISFAHDAVILLKASHSIELEKIVERK
jgi:UDP-N-acetylmuramoyl-tripeptide--D-alanyl-D-alanine ligase